jgi:hypothetical protein
MPQATSAAELNIHDLGKYLNTKQQKQVTMLTRMLSDGSLTGRVLQVLIGRIRNPEGPYSDEDLEVLLLVSLAEKRAALER